MNHRAVAAFVLVGAVFYSFPLFAQESPDSIVDEPAAATHAIEDQLSPPAVAAPPAVTVPAAPAEGAVVDPAASPAATAIPAEEEGALVAPEIPKQPMSSLNGIKLQVLDKVTARISVLEGPLGGVQSFGNLEIITRVCWKSPPTAQPDNAALLDIYERKGNTSPKRIFTGWMFSSSPAISALEHPVYDITVLECSDAKSDAL